MAFAERQGPAAGIVSIHDGESGPESKALDVPRRNPDQLHACVVALVGQNQTDTKTVENLGITILAYISG